MKSKITFILLMHLLILPSIAQCQNTNDTLPFIPALSEDTIDEVFIFVEEPASFPGGMDALNKFLVKNLKYPETDKAGTVFVEFVVEKDGLITNIKVRMGVDPLLDQAAIDVVKKMPRWIPGKQRTKPVRTLFLLPIQFSQEK